MRTTSAENGQRTKNTTASQNQDIRGGIGVKGLHQVYSHYVFRCRHASNPHFVLSPTPFLSVSRSDLSLFKSSSFLPARMPDPFLTPVLTIPLFVLRQHVYSPSSRSVGVCDDSGDHSRCVCECHVMACDSSPKYSPAPSVTMSITCRHMHDIYSHIHIHSRVLHVSYRTSIVHQRLCAGRIVNHVHYTYRLRCLIINIFCS